VSDRVTNGLGVMPSFAGKLSTAQIAAVAAYVSSTAGK
jgi:mono/diheme cytochrome c family protein